MNGLNDRLRAVGVPLRSLAYGQITCIVTFTASLRTRAVRETTKDLFWGDFRDVGDDGKQRFAFKIADVRKIPFGQRPTVTGRQGFFDVPNEIGLWG